tara:strand:- start:964 stop:1197 length:234 start_codon:yes stop_codon:yes gene_type:complete
MWFDCVCKGGRVFISLKKVLVLKGCLKENSQRNFLEKSLAKNQKILNGIGKILNGIGKILNGIGKILNRIGKYSQRH